MSSDSHPRDQRPADSGAVPGDVPAGRPAWLDHLDLLTGQWETEASFDAGFFGPGSPPITGRGRTSFEWLAGRHFLIQRFANDHPDAPSGIAIIGAHSEPGRFSQHYYDSRGVARVYQMSLDGTTWKLWREAPGFWQRYTGVISPGGDAIRGAWEGSADGRDWKHDFRLTYLKAG
jgi:Protein of unknown function (DUF1579)